MPTSALKGIRRAVLVAIAVLLSAAGPALADDALSVIIAQKTPPLMNALNLVAQGAGFYREEHLQVTTRFTDEAIKTLMSCTRGESDICPMPIEPMLEHYDDGVRMKMFISSADTFTVVIAVPEDGPLKTLADLKGKAIGVHLATGSAGVFPTQSALAAAGVKPGETTMVTVGMNQEAMDALASGKVAALGLPMYEMVPFIAAGAKLRILRHPILGHIANGGYASAPSVIAAKADALGRFSRAIVKTSLLIRYNPKAAARAFLTAKGEPFTDADVTRIAADLTAWENDLPASDPTAPRIGEVKEGDIQRYIQLLAQAGVMKRQIPAAEFVTGQFVDVANDFDHEAFEARAKAMR
ncbi:MAG TPA: ABC transporter substrate-binding protein [Caulobacteraceae bacterium]|nr:ABC transporter substrate-binding protein [Caulobacteraceae bacterium]